MKNKDKIYNPISDSYTFQYTITSVSQPVCKWKSPNMSRSKLNDTKCTNILDVIYNN